MPRTYNNNVYGNIVIKLFLIELQLKKQNPVLRTHY